MLRKFVSAFLIFSLCIVSFFIHPISVSASEKGDKWVIGTKGMAVASATVTGPFDGASWSASANSRVVSGNISGVFQVTSVNPNYFTIGHSYTIEFTYSCSANVIMGSQIANLATVSNINMTGKIMAPDGTTCGNLEYTTAPKKMSMTYTPNSTTGISNNFTFALSQTSLLTVNSLYYGTNRAFYTNVMVNVTGFTVTDITENNLDDDHLANIDKNIDDMMNGYDPSSGNNINDQLSNGLNEFDKVQGDLFNTAVDGMKDFKPGDVSMDVLDGNLLSGVWFVTTLLQAVYLSSGGLVGFGVIASVAFAVAFSAMVVGLYRYYIK